MVEGEYSFTSHSMGENPAILQARTQKLNTKETKLPINKRASEGNRLRAPSWGCP